jgi:gentisate 1,2-dioxygenase
MLQRSSIESSELDLQAYYDDLESINMSPLWTRPEMGLEPESKLEPFLWRWRDMRPRALRALELVGTQQADRRVICCVNPGTGRGATNTLVVNIQVVGPGEVARAHRHTPAALRMIIESTGGYTVVNGGTIPMLPGDLVLTPNWTWHDHGNDSDTPMLWLDGLDAPLVGLLEATFREQYTDETQRAREDIDPSLARFGAGALTPAWELPSADYSPLWHYPWTQAKAALDGLGGSEMGSPADGVIMQYTNPTTGGPVMPTIPCYVQVLKPGQHTRSHRHTNSTVYQVIEGQGTSIVGGRRFDWESRDVLTVPGWTWHEHVNESNAHPAYLFSFTDEPVFRALGLYREQQYEA